LHFSFRIDLASRDYHKLAEVPDTSEERGRCFIVGFYEASAAPNLGGCHRIRIMAARLA
jgi:hypothetical protein